VHGPVKGSVDLMMAFTDPDHPRNFTVPLSSAEYEDKGRMAQILFTWDAQEPQYDDDAMRGCHGDANTIARS
jgi:hypothetical protein